MRNTFQNALVSGTLGLGLAAAAPDTPAQTQPKVMNVLDCQKFQSLVTKAMSGNREKISISGSMPVTIDLVYQVWKDTYEMQIQRNRVLHVIDVPAKELHGAPENCVVAYKK